MATAIERNAKLNNPETDAVKIIAFFEELQKLMTGVEDKYVDGGDKYRQWDIASVSPTVANDIIRIENALNLVDTRLTQVEGTLKAKPKSY